eukprot:GHVL01026795.1.p1 GENE.GHVL01026795.1~~GHVL01026795.1.p1  ORF type:complete len:332 (-),score=57.61 GHVL01026795.1:921-1916(-)
MGLVLFRNRLSAYPTLKETVITAMLSLVERDRLGDQQFRSLLKNLLGMLTHLNMFKSCFEGGLLDESSTFYAAESARCLPHMEIGKYLALVDKRILEEQGRVRGFLDACSEASLLARVRDELLLKHQQTILKTGLDTLVAGNQLTDLHRLYKLYEQIDDLDTLKSAWGQSIQRVGSRVIQETNKELIKRLLDYWEKLSVVNRDSFKENEKFNFALKESFANFVNEDPNTPARELAKYVDELMRSGGGDMAPLTRALTLFRFLTAKDIFEAFYKIDLSKRLLLNMSPGEEVERAMIQKLKDDCGAAYTSRVEGMLRDMDISRESSLEFVQVS